MADSNKADWVGLALQFFVGSLLGLVVAFIVATPPSHWRSGYASISLWLTNGSAVWFFWGCAVLFGAFSSHMGDWFWSGGGGFGSLPIESPNKTPASIVVACFFGLIGILLVVFSLLKHFGRI